jgi:hypothetical protein
LDIVESVTPFMFSGNEYFSLVHLFNAVEQIKYLAERLAISSSTPSQMPVVKGAKKPVYRTMWGGTREQLRKILQRLTERECLTKGLPFITATVEDREAFVLLNTKRQNNDPTIPPEAPGMVWNGVNEKLYYLLVWLNRKRDPKTNKEYLGTSAKNLAVLAKSNFGLSAQVDTISTKIRNIDRNGYDEIKRREIDEILREVFGSE